MWGFNVNESYQEILKKIECPYGHTSVYCTTTRKDCRAEAHIILERVKTDNENNKILLMTFSQNICSNQSIEHMRERVRIYQFAIGHAEMLKTKLESEGFTFTEIDE